MKLGRPGIDAKLLGDHSPPFILLVSVNSHDPIRRLPAEPAGLKNHESVAGLSNIVKNYPDPCFRNTELGAHTGAKATKVRLGTDIQVVEESIKPPLLRWPRKTRENTS